MRVMCLMLGLIISSAACAFPPPAPPNYVQQAGDLLMAPAGRDESREDALFAPDVAVFENGTLRARSVADLHKLRSAERLDGSSRVLAYSEGWGRNGDEGDLLVLDTFDTVDRTNLPPTFLADPRMATRSILYQFGRDHLIHVVRIARADGFAIVPKDAPTAH